MARHIQDNPKARHQAAAAIAMAQVQRESGRAGSLVQSIGRLEAELSQLEALLPITSDLDERIMIRAEIAHFAAALERLRPGLGQTRRKPPEAGLPVPALPPSGPLPKQGGAAAPLEFDS